MLLIGGYASVCKDGMPALPFVSKRESRWGLNSWRILLLDVVNIGLQLLNMVKHFRSIFDIPIVPS